MAKKKEEENKKMLTPAEYFEKVNAKMETVTKEQLMNLYSVIISKLKKYIVTGQSAAAKTLYTKCLSLEKEVQLMDYDIHSYVSRKVIEDYIDNVADDCVVVIELRNYERDIPDEIVNKVAETRDIFDDFYVVFTDYTGEERSKVEKIRQEKDPILFGNIFEDGTPSDKMYFIGDWVDEYCDLTLSKMVEEIAAKKDTSDNVVTELTDFSDLKEIEEILSK